VRCAFVVLLLCLPALRAADDRPQRIADAELQKRINAAIDRGVAYLKRVQNKDGSWDYTMGDGPGPRRREFPGAADASGGLTALALYALAASGVPAGDGTIDRGRRWTEKNTRPFKAGATFGTYSASLLVLALTRIDARKHEKRIRKLAVRIVKGQRKSNMWTYGLAGGGGRLANGPLADGDNSNSQFAVLALWAARTLAKAKVPASTWRRVQGFYKKTQLKNGGWAYTPPTGSPMLGSSASMNAAGLVSFVYATAALGGSLPEARKHEVARRGLAAVRKAFKNYGDYYFVYALERVGTVLGLPAKEWYFEGARELLRRQRDDGRWASVMRVGHGDQKQVYQTSLALLFLSRATRFIVTTKGEGFPELTSPSQLARAFSYYHDINVETRRKVVHKFGAGGPAAVRLFIDKLADGDARVRATAYELLQTLVAKPFFYQPAAEAQDRKMMLQLIERWWRDHGAALKWDAGVKRFSAS